MKMRRHHAALWLCVDNSSMDRRTRRFLASRSNAMCQRPGMRSPLRSHISIAFSDTPNSSARTAGPPKRLTISEEVSFAMTKTYGTTCSTPQEHFVIDPQKGLFYVDDSPLKVRSVRLVPVIKTQKELSKTALERFQDVLTQMEWTEEWAIDLLWEDAGPQLKLKSKKAIEHWLDPKRGMAAHAIFIIAAVFGIDAGWLAGQDHAGQSLVRSGLAAREIERRRKQREMQPKKRA